MLAFSTKSRWVRKPVLEFLSAMLEADPRPRRHPTSPARSQPPKVGDDFVYDMKRKDIGYRLVGADELILGGSAPNDVEQKGVTKGL